MARHEQTHIQQVVESVRRRQQQQWFWKCVSLSSLFFAAIACFIAILRIPLGDQISSFWVVLPLVIGPALGAFHALVQPRATAQAASTIDRAQGLKDRTQTALSFSANSNADTLQKLQIEDAEKHLSAIDPNRVTPNTTPRTLPYAIGFSVLSLALLAITSTPPPVMAAAETNPTLNAIASQLDADFEKLKELQKEEPSEELEKLLKELEVQLEAFKLPGMDPKDAMAKLSEMESALQETQKQLTEPGVEAQLMEIGEALSLSQEMSAAGDAMSKGDMEKAEAELAKLEMPELDLKTEKAIAEKLEAVAKQSESSNSQKKKSLASAVSQIRESMANGDRSEFKEGMKGLAGECKSQGKKKKLRDLLRKQCQSLGECKSECEGACEKPGNQVKPGGSKPGSGASGNEAGDTTAKLKTDKKMDIQGQDSGQGETEFETEQAPEQEQQAVRNYQQSVEQYEALNESVLDSESIPLGQRQTIRKYFESIRPTHEETDAVLEKTE